MVTEESAEKPVERSLSALFSDNKKFQLIPDEAANKLFRFFNYIGLVVPMLVVLLAMTIQVFKHDIPCSHCNMQRLAYFMLALGPALNLRFGSRPSHYGLSLAGAFFLGLVALDQTVRISQQNVTDKDGNPGWGPDFLGLHMYGWSLVIALIAGVALILMLLWDRQFELSRMEKYRPSKKLNFLLAAALVIALAVISLDTVSVFLECGFSACPGPPPEEYLDWWD